MIGFIGFVIVYLVIGYYVWKFTSYDIAEADRKWDTYADMELYIFLWLPLLILTGLMYIVVFFHKDKD